MTTYEEKCRQFKQKLQEFKASKQNEEDVFTFVIAVWSATKFGSGISFPDVKLIIDEVYK